MDQGLVTHSLTVHLDPEGQRLHGRDRMVVTHPPQRLRIWLASAAHIESLTIGEDAANWRRAGDILEIPLPPSGDDPIVVTLAYSAVFDDAAPRRPVNTDNPGYGVRGTISDRGTVLLAGSGWYPQVADMARRIALTVTAPAGTLAVTSGRLIGHTTADQKTVSRWQIDQPVGPVSLCAGPYQLQRRQRGAHTAITYFSDDRQHLADAYLEASLTYLADYARRFGPYPFDHFAVVENFYPTGYGFPGFTLIGGRVLELPFIIPTSLRHEIAHCWWGNGVRVDPADGNWCEGLATYVADYAHRSEQGQDAVRDYRRQLMRNYTSLVRPEEATALGDFHARRDRITKAIGYDKGAMVFHMLHRQLGDGFWRALTDLFRERCFSEASWSDLQRYFQRHADHNLDPFFDQWLRRADAPRLRLEKLAFEEAAGVLSGVVTQSDPPYDLTLDLAVVMAGGPKVVQLSLAKTTTTFRIPLPAPPERVEADPDSHLFRRLWPEEIPATINSLKAAGVVAVRASPGAGEATRYLVELLPRALGLKRGPVHNGEAGAVLWIGPPGPDQLPPGARIDGDRLQLGAVNLGPQTDTVFAVWRAPEGKAIQALYWSPSMAAAESVLRKIPHYGKYSYLAFEGASNILKGTWPVTASPLRVEWSATQGETQ